MVNICIYYCNLSFMIIIPIIITTTTTTTTMMLATMQASTETLKPRHLGPWDWKNSVISGVGFARASGGMPDKAALRAVRPFGDLGI